MIRARTTATASTPPRCRARRRARPGPPRPAAAGSLPPCRNPTAGRLRRMGARLVTIPISHFCEKARWALDRAGVQYAEERHLQLLHVVFSRRAGGHGTVPVLVTEDGAVMADSSDILRWCDARGPAERAR